jgi:hypothetical protein
MYKFSRKLLLTSKPASVPLTFQIKKLVKLIFRSVVIEYHPVNFFIFQILYIWHGFKRLFMKNISLFKNEFTLMVTSDLRKLEFEKWANSLSSTVYDKSIFLYVFLISKSLTYLDEYLWEFSKRWILIISRSYWFICFYFSNSS